MKKTIDIADSLANEAKKIATNEGTTVRALVEEGLRFVIEARKAKRRFRLRDASVGGDGLTPEFRDASWEKFRDAIYGERDLKARGE